MIGGGSVCHDGGDYRACPGRLTNPVRGRDAPLLRLETRGGASCRIIQGHIRRSTAFFHRRAASR
ncbi:hypothetical protein NH44784_041861 [Achromobacter xylosoxidans NH44784-1996]|nr:hypothetical protein NH44784_041861 [Achromobacter xylosoxidans NH44784-1996]